MHFGLRRRELREDAPEPQRVLAERGAHPVVAGGRRVAFVEDQVDDTEHRRQPRRELGAARHLEGDLRLGERPLRAHDALRDRRLGDEKGARDLVGREAAEQAQRERDLRLGREQRMARGEDEPQQIVADVVVERGVEIGRPRLLLRVELVSELLVLALEQLVPAEKIDRAVLGGGHEPRTGIVGNPRLGPFLERDDERILREILGLPDVAARCARGRR